MYSVLPNLVIGFHGCDQKTYEKVIVQKEPLQPSKNDYDWLGNGIYFWENSEQRAWNWAQDTMQVKKPAVIGAVISLGNCLNLTDYKSMKSLQMGYEILKLEYETLNSPLPQNKRGKNSEDLLLRNLDCAVIQRLHQYNREEGIPPYDSVRGIFVEGGEIYPNSGFREKTHVQLCIINPDCIKGYFSPLQKVIDSKKLKR